VSTTSAENIVHIVLARLPDAPAGTRGISLFIVPKFLPPTALGERNNVKCGAASSTRWASRPRPPARDELRRRVGFMIGSPTRAWKPCSPS
jgi:hypothetical protein